MEKAVAAKAAAERATVQQVAPASYGPDASVPDPLDPRTPFTGRPPLETLLPRREPGANVPRTGAEAFLPPETSGASGPLFRKREEPTGPATPRRDHEGVELPAGADRPADKPSASDAERVARVVPITALAARQRAQAEDEARVAEAFAGQPTRHEAAVVAEEPPTPDPDLEELVAGEPLAERPHVHDPLSDPLPMPEKTPAVTNGLAAKGLAPNGLAATGLGGLPTRTRGASPEINRDIPAYLPSTRPRPATAGIHRSSSPCARDGSPATAKGSGTRPRSTAAGSVPSTWPRRPRW